MGRVTAAPSTQRTDTTSTQSNLNARPARTAQAKAFTLVASMMAPTATKNVAFAAAPAQTSRLATTRSRRVNVTCSATAARVARSARRGQETNRRNVQVHAKGKGKKMNRQGQGMQRPEIGVPPIDEENEEFVLFARSKKSALKNWYPFTIMVGGNQANFLVKAAENELGKTLTGDTLAKSLGATLYKERPKVEDMVKERVPYLKVAKELEFGFKVRNKDKPASWMFTDGVSAIPAEEDCKGLIDKVNDWAAQFS